MDKSWWTTLVHKNKIYQRHKALFSLGVSASIKTKGQTKRCSEVGNINIESTGCVKKRQHLIFMNIRLNLNSHFFLYTLYKHIRLSQNKRHFKRKSFPFDNRSYYVTFFFFISACISVYSCDTGYPKIEHKFNRVFNRLFAFFNISQPNYVILIILKCSF